MLLTVLPPATSASRAACFSLVALKGLLLLLVLLTRRYSPGAPSDPAGSDTGGMQPAEADPASPPRLETTTTVLVVALFFVDTGLEISAGQWSASFFENGRSVGLGLAGVLVSSYWGGLLAGRLA